MKYLLCPLHQPAPSFKEPADWRRCFINTAIHLFKDVMNVQTEMEGKKTSSLGKSSGWHYHEPTGSLFMVNNSAFKWHTYLFRSVQCEVHQDLSGNLLIRLFRVLWTHVNAKVFNKLPPPTRGHVQTLHRELQVDAAGSYSGWTSTPFGEQNPPDAVERWDGIDDCCCCGHLHPNATLLVSPAGRVEIMRRIHPRSYVILFSCSSRNKNGKSGIESRLTDCDSAVLARLGWH